MNILAFLKILLIDMRGDAAWDLIKKVWQETTKKDLEELYLEAFAETVKEERPRLEKYGDHIEFNAKELRNVLRQQLRVTIGQRPISELEEEAFIHHLAAALHDSQALTIGGHNLDQEDYQQILRNLVRQTAGLFRAEILKNEDAFKEMIVLEGRENRKLLVSIRDDLKEQFGLLMPELDELLQRTAQIDERTLCIDETTRQTRDLVLEIWQEIVHSRTTVATTDGVSSDDAPVFVAREEELDWLEDHFRHTLGGQGRVIFVTGETGSGKTALASAFIRQAEQRYPQLVSTWGMSDYQAGEENAYLPFKKIIQLLAGEGEPGVGKMYLTETGQERLAQAHSTTSKALNNYGRDVRDGFVLWRGDSGREISRDHLLQQYTNVLRAISRDHPLVVVCDDLQWADDSSIGLLAYLGRRIHNDNILIVGIYRADEVAEGRKGNRHPLERVINELKSQYGDITIDLAYENVEQEGRKFIDQLLSNEPNHLNADFRARLFDVTRGHPMFIIELLNGLKERGNIVKDEDGYWIEWNTINWQELPTRVEAVIAERIARLETELRELLTVASVEGEDFTAQVIARVQDMGERQLLEALSQELEKRRRLVREGIEEDIGHHHLSRFRFAHNLFQQHLYKELGSAQRRLLHGEVALVLEELYGEDVDEIAVQLAHHFAEAHNWSKAAYYHERAGDRAFQVSGFNEALKHYTQAFDLLQAH